MIGVIVPVHGFAPYLAETLDCVLAQEPAAGEVVVVDDASPEPLVLHPDHAPHCRLVRREACGGPAAARASGLSALSPGVRLVALCDGDDSWTAGALASQAHALSQYPDAGLCYGRALIVGPDGRPTSERWDEWRPGLHAGPDLAARLYESNPLPTSSVMLRRAALEEVGGFESPLHLGEDWDWDLWLRLAARAYGFVFEPQVVVRYRRHPGGLTADLARLARYQLKLHAAHGELVAPEVRDRVLAADAKALRSAQRRGLRALLVQRGAYG